jgi:DNA end-binding protein Ku
MEETGRSALARYAARGKQYLVLLRPLRGGLVMPLLLYADEVRPFSEVPVGQGPQLDLKEAEVRLARQLVEQISSEHFQPEQYEDETRKRVTELIQKKVEGQEISLAEPAQPRAQVIDLMEALRASLGKKAAAPAKSAPPEARKPPKRAQSEPAQRKAAKK